MSWPVILPLSLLLLLMMCLGWGPAPAAGQPNSSVPGASPMRTAWGAPDLRGVWSISTLTPLERPADLADTEFFAPQEAAEYVQRELAEDSADVRPDESVADVTRGVANYWYERGASVVASRRTSLVVDPRDGRIPGLTDEGRARIAGSIPYSGFQDGRHPASWTERGLWERCITRGLPNAMLPTGYNNNYQIFQTPDHIAILVEMIHNARIISLDGRPPLPSKVRQWMGDSRGRWEGDTLVVDTRNFTDKTNYHGSASNLHLIERFTRVDAETLFYKLTIVDPTAFERYWTVELPAVAMKQPLYEYACHEGNYSMSHALSGTIAIVDDEEPK